MIGAIFSAGNYVDFLLIKCRMTSAFNAHVLDYFWLIKFNWICSKNETKENNGSEEPGIYLDKYMDLWITANVMFTHTCYMWIGMKALLIKYINWRCADGNKYNAA